MPAKYAAVIGYDSAGRGRFSLAVAVKTNAGITHAVDSGRDAPIILHELDEAQAELVRRGFATERNAYTGDILGQAQARALALAGTL